MTVQSGWLLAVGQRIEADRALIACRVVAGDDWCRRRGCQGVPRDSVVRKLAHAPLGWRPTTLHGAALDGAGFQWLTDVVDAGPVRYRHFLGPGGVVHALIAPLEDES